MVENLVEKVYVRMNTIVRDGIAVPAEIDWDGLDKRRAWQVETLKAFVEIMEGAKLNYFLAYGSLLGLRRHNGKMIPWDDDVDVIMPRRDYESALSVLKKDSRFSVLEFTIDSDFRVKSAKVAKRELVKSVDSNYARSCYIDLFAMDKVPKSKLVELLQWKLNVLLENVVLARKGISSGWKRVVSLALGMLLPHSAARIHKIMVRLSFMHLSGYDNWMPNTLVGERYSCYGERANMPWKVYCGDKDVRIKSRHEYFEGIKVRVPEKIDEYLRLCYGDWQQLPNIEGRKPKHECDDCWFYSEM